MKTTYEEKLALAAEFRKNTGLATGVFHNATAAKIRAAHVKHTLPGQKPFRSRKRKTKWTRS